MQVSFDARSPTTAWASAASMPVSPPDDVSQFSSAGARSPVTLTSSRSPPTSPSPLPAPPADDRDGSGAAGSWCAHATAVMTAVTPGLRGHEPSPEADLHTHKQAAGDAAGDDAGAWTGATDPPSPPAPASAAPPPLAAAHGTLALRVDQQAFDYALRDAQARFEETRRLATENASLQQQLTRQRTAHEVDLVHAAALASQLEAELTQAREGGRTDATARSQSNHIPAFHGAILQRRLDPRLDPKAINSRPTG